ncbi:hypothetical protein BDA99DRAFT_533725 [Phascolomyces articulosus]|uniref:Uncharacterized protein n=1 Tax=Phascolomyces articulosus TaxID=60185 RepID=A0AAD5K7J6_9FUNG|nr:hypothetical protein BDA99DRAFT_533725 [Phascolomyces articulosus]
MTAQQIHIGSKGFDSWNQEDWKYLKRSLHKSRKRNNSSGNISMDRIDGIPYHDHFIEGYIKYKAQFGKLRHIFYIAWLVVRVPNSIFNVFIHLDRVFRKRQESYIHSLCLNDGYRISHFQKNKRIEKVIRSSSCSSKLDDKSLPRQSKRRIFGSDVSMQFMSPL